MPVMRGRVAAAVSVALTAGVASAQPADILLSGRDAATSGHRDRALIDLETHLRTSPRDVDARLLYGLVLSWEGRYADARSGEAPAGARPDTELQRRPGWQLANIAWWNGDYTELKRIADDGGMRRPGDVEWMLQDARALDGLGQPREARQVVQTLLSQAPGHPQARSLKNRLDASLRPWTSPWATAPIASPMAGHRGPIPMSAQPATPVGSVIARASHVERFGLSDRMFEVEMYPSFRPGTYGFVSVGVRQGRPALSGLPRGNRPLSVRSAAAWELSAGFRRLAFTTMTDIYAGSAHQYSGSWMLTGKTMYVPDRQGPEDSVSFHAPGAALRSAAPGESFVGFGYSHGYSRDELEDRAELLALDADTLRASAELLVHPRWLLAVAGSSSRQERTSGSRCGSTRWAARSRCGLPGPADAGEGRPLMPALAVCCSRCSPSAAAGTRCSCRRRSAVRRATPSRRGHTRPRHAAMAPGTTGDAEIASAVLDALLVESRDAFAAERWSDALEPTEQLVERIPGQHIYLARLADTYHHLGRPADEAAAWELFMASPLMGEACPFIGHAYRKLGKYDQALAAFERCYQADTRNAELAFFVGLGNEWTSSSRPPRSGTGRAIVIAPPHYDSEVGLARLQLHRGHLGRRARRAQAVLKHAPTQVDAMLVAGLAEQRAGHRTEARSYLEKAAKLSEDYFDVQLALGVLEYSDSRYHDARGRFLIASRLDVTRREEVQPWLDRTANVKVPQ